MPDSDESLRQHMQEEAAQKLDSVQRHFALLAAMSIILPSEGDALAIERQQAMIRDSDPMRIPAQIAEDFLRASKGRLGVDYPVAAMEAAQKLMELFRLGQYGGGAGTAEPNLPRNTRLRTLTGRKKG
jgi:hypothetical protein